MPATYAFYPWQDRVHARFAPLAPRYRQALAEYRFGLFLARCGGLTSVVAYLATGGHAQRLRESSRPADVPIGSARTVLGPSLCFAPLLRWAAADHPEKRLVLALDPTCLTDRFRILRVAVLDRGCGLSVACTVQAADEKGR